MWHDVGGWRGDLHRGGCSLHTRLPSLPHGALIFGHVGKVLLRVLLHILQQHIIRQRYVGASIRR